jgi:hypothetical protein
MLVYPKTSQVELYYGFTLSDNVARVLTGLGVLALGALLWMRASRWRRNRPAKA